MKHLSSLKNRINSLIAEMDSQTGWTTMEYVVGAIALVGVIGMVIRIFGEKLVEAVGRLTI